MVRRETAVVRRPPGLFQQPLLQRGDGAGEIREREVERIDGHRDRRPDEREAVQREEAGFDAGNIDEDGRLRGLVRDRYRVVAELCGREVWLRRDVTRALSGPPAC